MHASYLSPCFNLKEQDKVIRNLRAIMIPKKADYDGFIVKGVSGITIGAILSRSLRKRLVIVRNPNTDEYCSHSYLAKKSGHSLENYQPYKRFVFLDDLIASGSTLKIVKDTLIKFNAGYPGNGSGVSKIVGILLYNYHGFTNVQQHYFEGDEMPH